LLDLSKALDAGKRGSFAGSEALLESENQAFHWKKVNNI
jgi:hypothetical protein